MTLVALSAARSPLSPQAAGSAPPSRGVTQAAQSDIVAPTEEVRARPQRTGLCALHVEFCKYRGLYRQVGAPSLVLGGVVLPLWLLVRLHRIRVRGRPSSARREILLLAFVVYLVALATLTLTPNGGSRSRAEGRGRIELRPELATLTCASPRLATIPNGRMFCVQNAAGNVLLFFPLGILLPLAWRQMRLRHAILIAVALSVGIELAQYFPGRWGSHRSVDINDVILNGIGASLGLAVVAMVRGLRRPPVTAPRGSSARTGG